VLAEQVRIRQDLRPLEPASELDLELRLLVGRRRDLAAAQTRRPFPPARPPGRHLPGPGAGLGLTTKGPLVLLTRFVTPADLRAAAWRLTSTSNCL
jgi:hypothetical protein